MYKLFYNVIDNMFLIFFNLIVYNELLKIKCREVFCDYFMLIRYYYCKVCVDMYWISYFFFKDIENFVKICKVFEFIVFDKVYVYFFLFFCYYDMYKWMGCFWMFLSF